MTVQRHEQLEGTITTYDLLASIFLTLPDESMVASITSGSFRENLGSAALSEIANYGRAQRERPAEDVLLDLARDRVRLIRGVNMEGIEPPYESMYVGHQANMSIGSLNNFYEQLGYIVGDDVKDAPDQLGVELAFAKLILEQELHALNECDIVRAAKFESLHQSFLDQHMGRWATAYAKKMVETASTGFYRGIGMLIGEVLPTPALVA
ncbi:MAG: molecular chaperone TorD family protein [Gordonibacter sp.]|uniref:TorD/DmsD family molecular chaperone n=1 Tax=Gordonibacter sp. TaxID=1968902 RepID=UPI002FC7BC8E